MATIRLVNVHTLALHQFKRESTPPYAIASHRWQDNEATYDDFVRGLQRNTAGYAKIIDFCAFLRAADASLKELLGICIEWLWIDTCCIKKSDVQELSEAVNSMYDWYSRAHICLAYLADIGRGQDWRGSSWFTRGWTLQELLTPPLLLFLDRDWQVRGHKRDKAFAAKGTKWLGPKLNTVLPDCTGIDASIFDDLLNIEHLPFNVILAWMSHRRTTKAEDQAYCLFGLMRVSMPVLYGERELAMVRLLEAVYKKCLRRSRLLQAGMGNSWPGKSAEALTAELALIDDTIGLWLGRYTDSRYENRARALPVLRAHA